MVAVGDIVYCGLERGPGAELVLIDVRDPRHPVPTRAFEIDADVNAIDVLGRLAFLATSADDAELLVLDLESGVRRGSYDAPGTADGVSVLRGIPPFAVLGTAPDPGHPETFVLDVTNVTEPMLFTTREALADLRNPLPLTRTRAGCFAGGTVVARARGTAVPALTLLAVDRITRELQVFAGLDDEVTIPDVDGDGRRRVACLGDSNTFQLFDKNPASWCAFVQQRIWHPEVVVTNYAELGAAMTPAATSRGQAQLQQALAEGADVVVLAFGGNDVVTFEPEAIVEAAVQLARQASDAGAVTYVATIVPRFDDPLLEERTDRASALMRAAFDPAHTFDFNALVDVADMGPDLVHVGPSGAVKQGELVERALVRATDLPAGCPRRP